MIEVEVEVVVLIEVEVVAEVVVEVGVRFRIVFLLARGLFPIKPPNFNGSVGRGALAEGILFIDRSFGSAGGGGTVSYSANAADISEIEASIEEMH